MSLDVYLTLPGTKDVPMGERIFIREEGQNRQISREEWDRRFPGRAPVVIAEYFGEVDDEQEVFHGNITHNLNTMAEEAELYWPMWQPGEIGIVQAKQLIQPLTDGLACLVSDPEHYEKFNPENGWGTYEGLVEFVHDYLEACIRFPEAKVGAWR